MIQTTTITNKVKKLFICDLHFMVSDIEKNYVKTIKENSEKMIQQWIVKRTCVPCIFNVSTC